MRSNVPPMPPARPIVILAVLQITTIVLGFVALGFVLKSFGWGRPDVTFRFSEWAVSLRRYSPMFLLVPGLWTVLSLWVESRDSGSPLSTGFLIAGGALAVLFLFAYLTAILSPGYQPLTIGR